MGRLKKELQKKGEVALHCLRQTMNIEEYHSMLETINKHKIVKLIHAHMIQTGFNNPELPLQNSILCTYSKSMNIPDTEKYFNQIKNPDTTSWTALISLYSKAKMSIHALSLFQKMQKHAQIPPDYFTLSTAISACARLHALRHGQELHAQALRRRLVFSDVFVGSSLVDLYAKCGEVALARQVFDKMPEVNVVSWNSLISGYCEVGMMDMAFECFDEMTKRTPVTWNIMITGYARNGQADMALDLFEKMQEAPSIVTFNAIIQACAQGGIALKALGLFRKMIMVGFRPNESTLAGLGPALGDIGKLECCRGIHGLVIQYGLDENVTIGNVLIDAYCKCKGLDEAMQFFSEMPSKDVISWNAIVSGYVVNDRLEEAAKIFEKMGDKKNVITYNIMIGGYTKNNQMDEALQLFESMPVRNVVSWTSMVSGYSDNGYFKEALEFYRRMKREKVEVNKVTFTCIVSVCANLAALETAREVHQDVIEGGHESDLKIQNTLIHMYAKCGSLQDACSLFEKMKKRDLVSWNTLINSYAMHGRGAEALKEFERMKEYHWKPNSVTFLAVLSACCHSGLVDEGRMHFWSMTKENKIKPSIEHYCCMIDLLGKAGHLKDAIKLIERMNVEPNAAIWASLLASCRTHNHLEMGVHAANKLFKLDPTNSGHYVLLSNMYAAAGKWADMILVREKMKEQRVSKFPGCSWIEVDKQVHNFVAGDKSHPQSQKIYEMLEDLAGKSKETGLESDIKFVFHDIEEEQKEHALQYHSEKLAIAFGLLNTPPGTSLRVIKNLRVCGDCHSTIKCFSKIAGREILVRDTNRFHHFKDGNCSCKDYW